MARPGECPDHYVAVIQDINARKVAESQLAQAREHLHQIQKLDSIGRLAGGIAHDLNNVLMPIVGYTQLLMAEFPSPGQVHDDLKEIYRAAERASSLVRQILAFSRKQMLQVEELDVNGAVNDFASMLTRVIGEHIELRLALAPDLSLVRADRSQLEQVLLNLSVNARDAMPHGGRLVIRTASVEVGAGDESVPPGTPRGPCVRVSVEDSGRGMDDQTREHVFEPFFTTKSMGEGTGLGLATVFGIVKQHGGHIAVRSEPGRGTTFTIWLPAIRVSKRGFGDPGHQAAPSKTTVMVVEDDASVRRFVTVALRSRGFAVIDFERPADALDVAQRADPIDLLLTDVVMPGMNGHELYQRLVQIRPTIKVLFMSGYTDEIIADHGLVGRGVMLLQKPFAIEALMSKVREAIGGRSEQAR
jgi:nitrogen-specific signal transduction histidine kinase/CheY-like chemotaxis protein